MSQTASGAPAGLAPTPDLTTFSIVGAGHIGAALAGHFSRCGIAVGVANSGRDELPVDLGTGVSALSFREALLSDVVILAVPFTALGAIAASGVDWNGRIVVDAMNAHEELDRPSSLLVAETLPGARVVKAFNQLSAAVLAANPSTAGGTRVVFAASDDAVASSLIANLVARLGFVPIELGALDQGGRLIDFSRGELVLRDLIQLDSRRPGTRRSRA